MASGEQQTRQDKHTLLQPSPVGALPAPTRSPRTFVVEGLLPEAGQQGLRVSHVSQAVGGVAREAGRGCGDPRQVQRQAFAERRGQGADIHNYDAYKVSLIYGLHFIPSYL